MQECRYCLFSDNKLNDLIDPCNCRGSMKYVHEKCLIDWIINNNKESRYKFEDKMQINLLNCEICHFDMKYIKEYENGIVISLIKTVSNMMSSVKKLSILLLHSTFLILFAKRLRIVYLNFKSLLNKKSFANTIIRFLHEIAIFLSIYLGIYDIISYYRKKYNEKRKMTMRFLNKDTNEKLRKTIQSTSKKTDWILLLFRSDLDVDLVDSRSDSN